MSGGLVLSCGVLASGDAIGCEWCASYRRAMWRLRQSRCSTRRNCGMMTCGR